MKGIGTRHMTRIRWFTLVATLLCLSLWSGTEASAQASRPCADDIAKFCKDVEPGGGGIMKCLKEHASEVSPVCKDHIMHMGKKRSQMQACKGDVDKFCKDIKPGDGRIVRCLKRHESDLSPGCKEGISQARNK